MIALLAAIASAGTFCGAGNHCVPLAAQIAVGFGGRNYPAGYAAAPGPAPYYKIEIPFGGEGHIAVTVIWVPTKQLVRVAEHVTPPNPPYWEATPPAAIPYLERLARRVTTPIAASHHWH